MSELDDVKHAHIAAMQALASGSTVIIELQLRIRRLEQTIRSYRDMVDELVQGAGTDSLIEVAERTLTADDRRRIGS